MNTKKMFVFAILAMVALVASAKEEENESKPKEGGLVPSMDLGFARLKLRGLAQVYGSSTSGVDGKTSASLTNMRLSMELKDKAEKWGGSLLLNFAKFQQDTNKDVLMLANVSYSVDESLTLRGGRFFAAGGFTTPIAAMNETVSYPTCDPTGSFVWGIQAEKLFGEKEDGILLLADVGGRSVTPFYSEENWKGPEFSIRLQKNFGKSWLAGTTQCSEDYQRIAIDSQMSLAENLYLRGALYYARNDEKTSDKIGGYALLAWEVIPRVELHGMIDWWSLQTKSWPEIKTSVSSKGKVTVEHITAMSKPGYEANATIGVRAWLDPKRTTTVSLDLVKNLVSPTAISATMPEENKPLRVEGRISFWW